MNQNYEHCPPNAEAAIESYRSLGYDFGVAVADIIDNSITAGATQIWIIYEWVENDTYISITDNGSGMSDKILYEAMRIGTKSPTKDRSVKDLGRFGLGLKTASFSQCRKLTVKTKLNNSELTCLRKWDLDFVVKKNDWFLLKETDSKSHEILDIILPELISGTVVLWENMDRLIETDDESLNKENYFYQKIDFIKKYLGMIFHRYLDSPNPLKIYIGTPDNIRNESAKVKSWDPFIRNHKVCRELDTEPIPFKDEKILVTPFILPHHSKFSTSEQFNNAAGPYGWNFHQGFYVYRNKRLLEPGTWFGFYKKEDHYKLARIRIDISNTLDSDWRISVKKNSVIPPDSIKKEIKRIAKLTREEATKAYRFRGKLDVRGNPKVKEFIWKRTKPRSRVIYRVDKKHPIIESIVEKTDKKLIYQLLALIEETVPIETIVVSDRENPDGHLAIERKLEDEKLPILEWFEFYCNKFMDDLEISKNEAINKILGIEPFCFYKNEILAIHGEEL